MPPLNVHRLRLLFFALLIIVLNFTRLPGARGQVNPPSYCWQNAACLTDVMLDGGTAIARWWEGRPTPEPAFVPPAGAGEVILPPGEDTFPEVCSLTPSTGQMGGVNVRSIPSMEGQIIDAVALGEYREVTAVGSTWHETRAPNGRIGYVAARVAALVGPCGDLPRQD